MACGEYEMCLVLITDFELTFLKMKKNNYVMSVIPGNKTCNVQMLILVGSNTGIEHQVKNLREEKNTLWHKNKK